MLTATHRFFLALYDQTRAEIHREEAKTLQPIYEDLLFTAVRSGRVANDGKTLPARVEPRREGGELVGLTASLGPLSKSYPLRFFRDQALEAFLSLRADGKEETEKRELLWGVEVEPMGDTPRSKLRLSVSRKPLPLEKRRLSSFGFQQVNPDDRPLSLFVASKLMDELRELTANSLHEERADVLTGHLIQEREGRVAAVLLERISVETGASASATHFSFSPLSFEAAQRECAGRGGVRSILGWHHNHPPPCGQSCLMLIPACKTETVFLSSDDRAVFRASFGAAYMVGLVSGKGASLRADEPVVRAYGWGDAVLREIDFTLF